MRRFWLENPQWQGDQHKISGELFHHLHEVCRFAKGDHFELLADGEAWLVEVASLGRKDLLVRRLERREIAPLPRPHIHLALSLPRFSKVDWIVEKSVEIGVKSLQLFVSDFSFVRNLRDVPKAKMERWEKLVRQATQQAGRAELMELPPVQTLADLLGGINQSAEILRLFPYEGDCPKTLKEALSQRPHRKYSDVWAYIGSEGGFSQAEVKRFAEVQMEPVTLGRQVLRVETACVALASILKYELTTVD